MSILLIVAGLLILFIILKIVGKILRFIILAIVCAVALLYGFSTGTFNEKPSSSEQQSNTSASFKCQKDKFCIPALKVNANITSVSLSNLSDGSKILNAPVDPYNTVGYFKTGTTPAGIYVGHTIFSASSNVPKKGVFQNLGKLKSGNTVKVQGKKFTVYSVDTKLSSAINIVKYIHTKQIVLITCVDENKSSSDKRVIVLAKSTT